MAIDAQEARPVPGDDGAPLERGRDGHEKPAICDTWAATMRHPSGRRTQLWVCRPIAVPPTRTYSVQAVPKSSPKLVIEVRVSTRCGAPPGRERRKAAISSMP